MRLKIMKLYHLIALALILVTNSPYAAECIYVPKQSPNNPHPELSPQGKCGQLINRRDTLQLDKNHFNNLYFAPNGLASIWYDGAIFYVSKKGKVARTHFYDNGADYFVEGVARTISNNKFGYIDEQLNIVIKPEYDFAFPFKNGTAVVCNGCQPESDGEHTIVVGGKWGVINRDGKVVTPLEYGKKEILKKRNFRQID